MAQRFTTKNPPAKTQPSKVKDSVDVKTPNQDAVNAYAALKAGRLADARKFLAEVPPSAASEPLAMFVRAALNENAIEAAGIYKKIAAGNPSKPIGHDALLQLYKYHFAAGDYNSAHTDYAELQKYPKLSQTESLTDPLVDPAGLKDSIQTSPDFTESQNQSEISGVPLSGEFIVQVGLFSVQDNAQKFVDELRSKNIDGAIFTRTESGKTFYVVSAGRFPTRDAAEAFAINLKKRSINCMVVPSQSPARGMAQGDLGIPPGQK